jgi:type II secretory pathway pseudopilin PulG
MIKNSLKNNNFKRVKFDGGFTLLEALVAISILMVAVVAPITIAQKGLSSAVYTKNQMIASYLAQDAIEYVKNKRDENILNKYEWLEDLGNCLNNLSCQIDTITGSILPYLDNQPLHKDPINNFYGYETGGTKTNFIRKINITKKEINDFNEALINVVVRWDSDENNKVDVSTLIFNY